jgi:hypothetical protein
MSKNNFVHSHHNNNKNEKINIRRILFPDCSIWYNSYNFKGCNNDVGVISITTHLEILNKDRTFTP